MSAPARQIELGPLTAEFVKAGGATHERDVRRNMSFSLAFLDAVMLSCAFLLGYLIRFKLHLTVAPEIMPSAAFYGRVGLILIPVWLALFTAYGLYNPANLLGGTTEYSRAFNASTTGMMLVVLASFLQLGLVIARGWLVTSWILAVFLVSITRFSLRRVIYAAWRRGHWLTPAIVVGTNDEAASLAEQFARNHSAGFQVIGVVDTLVNGRALTSTPAAALPSLGTVNEIVDIILTYDIREVVVAASSLEREKLLELYERIQPLRDVKLRLTTGLYEVLTTGVEVRTVASVPLIELNKLRLTSMQAAVKSVTEYGVAVMLLILAAPFMAFIALLIKFESPGPLIHRRSVLGVGGKEFDAFKFRTMYMNGDAILDRIPGLRNKLIGDGKLKDDPRVTRVGRFLRHYSLDELPQLCNVLRGEMGLVGPRMITAQEGGRYGRHRLNLMTVKPGITGLWQVSGRSELSYVDRVRLDMHYIRNYSIWLDLQILLVQTPSAVLRGRGAY